MSARFPPGRIVATPNALNELAQSDIDRALARHLSGEWGDVGEGDRKENELSLKQGFRLFSVYHSHAVVKSGIITEADRSATTILLLEDY